MTERVTITNEGGAKKVTTTDAGSKVSLDVTLLKSDGTDGTDEIIAELEALNSLAPSKYDYVSMAYTTPNSAEVLTTVVFKSGGSGGTTISTLTLGYDGNDNLTSVTKT